MIRSLLVTASTLFLVAVTLADDQPADSALVAPIYARIELADFDRQSVQRLRDAPEVSWWVELGDELLVLAEADALGRLAPPGTVETLGVEPQRSRLHIVRGARLEDLAQMDVDVLALGGRHAVIQARADTKPELPHADHGAMGHHQAHAELVPFEPNLALARVVRDMPARRLSKTARRWSELVDGQRWFNDASTLAGYDRYTHGTEVHDARAWLVAQFEALPGLTVETPSFQVGGTTAYNVVATHTGTTRPDEIFVIGAHYDSISQSTATATPGAEDNASGCAGVLELARVLTSQSPPSTVIFVCYSGEEQGLFGGTDHASDLVAQGLDDNVLLALNMDMIGYTGDADLDCLLETSSDHAALVDIFTAAAAATDLRIVTSFFPFGSDHVPYLNRGMPALLTIENDWNSYPCYHRTCDVASELSLDMGREILEMNAAVLAEMMGQGGAIFSDGFDAGNLDAWTLP